MDNLIFLIVLLTLAILSTISSSIVIYSHIKILQLRKHPGQMVIIICIVQIITDLQWITALSTIREEVVNTGICYYFSLVFNPLSFLSWNVFSCLVLELVIKLKFPLSTNYRKRNKFYFLLIFIVTAFEYLPMLYFGGFGLSAGATCFVKEGSFGYWFALIPMMLNIPFNFTGIIILKRSSNYNKNKALQKMVLVCVAMSVTLGIPLVAGGTSTVLGWENSEFVQIAFIVGSSSGIVLAICRLGSVKILKKLRPKRFRRKKYLQNTIPINEVLIEEASCSNCYNKITEETFKQLISYLCLTLCPKARSSVEFSFSYQKQKYTAEENAENIEKVLVSQRLQKDEIWEYGKEYFDKIKKRFKVYNEDILNSFLKTLEFSLEDNNYGGKSGAFILATSDEKFVLKIIKRKERIFLLDILPDYTERVNNGDSYIVKIFGIYKVRSSGYCFMVMENIVINREKCLIFDLKGSKHNRYTDEKQGEKLVLKDRNFLEKTVKIKIGNEKKDFFFTNLMKDLNFFMEYDIVDYSLLVGFYNKEAEIDSKYKITEEHVIGIIDFLQEYSFRKKAEVIYKTIRCQKNFSICSPKKYSKRLVDFLRKHLFVN